MEPSDALFNVVEASIALAGFAGIVTALGQRSSGRWRSNDRARIVDLLVATLIPFGLSLFSLILIYAGIDFVWRAYPLNRGLNSRYTPLAPKEISRPPLEISPVPVSCTHTVHLRRVTA